MNVNGELQPPAEEIDSSIADNLSVASADDGIYMFSESQNLTENPENAIHCTATTPACPEGVVSGAISSGAEEEGEDSTGDDDGRLMSLCSMNWCQSGNVSDVVTVR